MKNGAKFKTIWNYNLEDALWLLSIELKLATETFCLHGIYWSQVFTAGKYVDFVSDFGDANIDLLVNDFYSRKLKKTIGDSGMVQIINEPTRIGDTKKSLIDHVMTNSPDQVNYDILHDYLVSDHCTIELTISECVNVAPSKSFQMLKYEKDDVCSFLSEMMRDEIEHVDVDEKTKSFMSVIKKSVEEFTKELKVKDKCCAKWFTDEPLKLKLDRDITYKTARLTNSASDRKTYRRMRNKYSNKLRYANDFKKDIQKCNGDQKGMWRLLKTLINKKKSCKPQCIEFSDGVIDNEAKNESVIAESFNRFFISSVVDINKNIESSNSLFDPNSIKRCPYALKFKEISIDCLRNHANNLKDKSDFNKVSLTFIRDAWDVIGESLLDIIIINSSLRTGIVSEIWKNSMVVTVEKISHAKKPEDFRPVNMLCNFEKILESAVIRPHNQK